MENMFLSTEETLPELSWMDEEFDGAFGSDFELVNLNNMHFGIAGGSGQTA